MPRSSFSTQVVQIGPASTYPSCKLRNLPTQYCCTSCGHNHALKTVPGNGSSINWENQKALANHLCSPLFKVRRGVSGKEYNLHRDILATKSAYFFGLLNSPVRYEEVKNSGIVMDAESGSEEAYEAFATYLYTNSYGRDPEATNEELCLLHAQVYLLADYLLMEDLKLVSLSMMKEMLDTYDKVKWGLQTETFVDIIDTIYTRTISYAPDATEDDSEDKEPAQNSIKQEPQSAPEDPKSAITELPLHSTVQTIPANLKSPTTASKSREDIFSRLPWPGHTPRPRGATSHSRKRSDAMRALLVGWAAKHFLKLRDQVHFQESVRCQPEFAVELLLAVEIL